MLRPGRPGTPTAPTHLTSERPVTIPARPWSSSRPTTRRSDAHGATRRRASRLRIPAFLLVGAAVVVAVVPIPGVDTRLTVGILLLLAAAALARILTDAARAH